MTTIDDAGVDPAISISISISNVDDGDGRGRRRRRIVHAFFVQETCERMTTQLDDV